MGVENTVPRIMEAKLLSRLKKNLVYGNIVNRDYEGTLKRGGNAILINEVGPVTMTAYAKNTDITWSQTDTADKELLVDQAYYFAQSVDRIDNVQSVSALMEGIVSEATYSAANTIDAFIATKYSKAGSTVTALTVTVANSMVTLSKMQTKLLEKNVTGEIFMPIPPWLHQHLLNAATGAITATGVPKLYTDGLLVNGYVGKLYGINLLLSNNVNNNSTIWNTMAFSKSAISFVQQISDVEYIPSLQDQFGAGTKALYVYGAKMIRPNAAVKCLMTKG